MAVTAPQGTNGTNSSVTIPVPVGSTTVATTNPNSFPVYVTASNSISPATIT